MKSRINPYLTPVDGDQIPLDNPDSSFQLDDVSEFIKDIANDYLNDQPYLSDSSTLFNSPQENKCLNTKLKNAKIRSYEEYEDMPELSLNHPKVSFDISLRSQTKMKKRTVAYRATEPFQESIDWEDKYYPELFITINILDKDSNQCTNRDRETEPESKKKKKNNGEKKHARRFRCARLKLSNTIRLN